MSEPLTLAALERLFGPVNPEPWKCPACGGGDFHPLVTRYFEQQWRSVMKPGEADPIGRLFCIYPKSWTG
jgi:hypothetical protein